MENSDLNLTKIEVSYTENFVLMDPEMMMQSDWASGFPQFMMEALEHLDFEDLLKTRLVSTGFYDFLMEEKQRKIWIQACTKILSSIFQKLAKTWVSYSNVLEARRQLARRLSTSLRDWRGMTDNLQQWINLFESIKEAATIPQIVRVCHLLRKSEALIPFHFPLSMISEISRMFPNLSEQIPSFNPLNDRLPLYYFVSEQK